MMTKTEWLDWLESSTDRLQERYREAWTRLPRRARRAQNDNLEPDSKPWCAIQHEIDREPREVVVHLELPAPHTVEADVRVIGSTLAIAVLRTGTNIARAPTEDCYRRAIPLPPKVDPGSAVHKIHGDELVIRMQPETAAQEARPARATVAARRRRAAAAEATADFSEAVPAHEAAAELEPEDAMGDITVRESTAAEPSAEAGPVEARTHDAMAGDDDAMTGDASRADDGPDRDSSAGANSAEEKAAASTARRTKSTPRKAAAKAGTRTRKAPANGTKAAARRSKRTPSATA